MKPIAHRLSLTLLGSFVVLLANSARAETFEHSFTGVFFRDNNVQLFDMTVAETSIVTIRTLSYSGGVNAAGVEIPEGGFDPVLSLFDSSRDFISDNDDGGESFDSLIEEVLEPGDYTIALTQYDNFFDGEVGENIDLGFRQDEIPDFTTVFGSAPLFNDFFGEERTGSWAFDVRIESTAVPEPSALTILGLAAAVSASLQRRRRSTRSSDMGVPVA